MTQIYPSEDCGNSPKNQFVEKLSIALAIGDLPEVLERVTETVQWKLAGEATRQGKEAVRQAIAQRAAQSPLSELTILHVATHGKIGAVNGTFRQQDGTSYDFCHVYEFSSAKATHVQTITSYVIQQA
jgi:hypothetical protein